MRRTCIQDDFQDDRRLMELMLDDDASTILHSYLGR